MNCQLGFDNRGAEGGQYTDSNMGAFLGKIYNQLAIDDNIDPGKSIPQIVVDMMHYDNHPGQEGYFTPDMPWLHALFGKDEYNKINEIYCNGFGTKKEGDDCNGCPYYRK